MFEQTQTSGCGSRQNPGFPQQQMVSGTRLLRFQDVLKLGKPHSRIFNVETKLSSEYPELAFIISKFARLVLKAICEFKMEEHTT